MRGLHPNRTRGRKAWREGGGNQDNPRDEQPIRSVFENDENFFGDWNFTAGVSLSIPIFHFGTGANKVRAAKARYEQTISEEAESNELMALEMTLAANNLDEAVLERDLAEISLRTATENLRMSESQYRAGVEPLSDLLEAQLMWQQAEQQLIEANINTYVRWVEYQKATGEIN